MSEFLLGNAEADLALAAWFHKRDELFELRSEDALAEHTQAALDMLIGDVLHELVEIGDELVAELAPSRADRLRVTGEGI